MPPLYLGKEKPYQLQHVDGNEYDDADKEQLGQVINHGITYRYRSVQSVFIQTG